MTRFRSGPTEETKIFEEILEDMPIALGSDDRGTVQCYAIISIAVSLKKIARDLEIIATESTILK